jgi:multidrug efflux pump
VRIVYTRLLTGTLNYRPVTLTLAAIVILLIPIFYMFSGKELAPKEDQGVVFGIIQAAPNSTLDQTTLYTSKFNDVLASIPEKDHVFQLTFPSGDSAGFSGMVAKPWSERKRTTLQIMGELQRKAAAIPGIGAFVTTPSPLPGGTNFPVEFVIASTGDPRELLSFAKQIQAKAMASGMFTFSLLDLKYDQPQAEIVFDRDKVASLGLNLSQVGADLSTMLGGNYVNRFSIDGRSSEVIPEVTRSQRLNPSQLMDFYVSGPDKQLVPLSTFATIKVTSEPRQLNRFQQLNSVKLQAGLIPAPNVTLDKALKVLETEAAKILPKGYTMDYAGESRQLRVEGSKFLPLLALSIILIFLVLAAQFESFSDPFIILLGSVPLALAGALAFSFLGLTTLNVYSNVGLVTLIGLVSKNGILIVEFANKLQERGLSKLPAVIEAAATRLRPILMTSVATVAGHFPLILASGPGAGARNSIGWVLVSGMIIGTFFTLFIVPSIYMLMARNRHGGADRRRLDFEHTPGEFQGALQPAEA